MTRADKPASVPSRPTLFDFLLVVGGFALSIFLAQATSLMPMPKENAPPAAEKYLVPILPLLLHLTEGVILLWPIFLLTQRILGRREGLTSGEWLWVFAWLVAAVLTGLAWWQRWDNMPTFLREHLARVFLIGYLVVLPSMAAVAAVLILLGLIGRWQQPWTHTFGLVLIGWSALPAAAVFAFTQVT
jgi:hypothetical protein